MTKRKKAAPKNKARSRKRSNLIILGFVLLTIVATVIIALPGRQKNLRLQEEKKRVSTAYLASISNNELDDAYEMKSVVYTKENSVNDFKKYISKHDSWFKDFSYLDGYHMGTTKTQGWTSCKTFSATVHYTDGTTSSLRMKVRPSTDGSRWKIIDETFQLSKERKAKYNDYTDYPKHVTCTDKDKQ